MKKLNQSCDFTGKIALVTGARIKLGFSCALKLLRGGATVIATTRFPNNAIKSYQSQSDYKEWSNRLFIVRADFTRYRDIMAVVEFCNTNFTRLDILINNAAQTIRRPKDYYNSILEHETNVSLPPDPTEFKFITDAFPKNQYDIDGQQIDLRKQTSWRMTLQDVPYFELIEVTCINMFAPFILSKELFKLMAGLDPTFIVNVSSTEGIFFKDGRNVSKKFHIHTNMAKSALNMLTESCHGLYEKDNIYVNSVDPGYISDMRPAFDALRLPCPLTLEDGAARILDPIVYGLTYTPYSGKFLKNYKEYDWTQGKV